MTETGSLLKLDILEKLKHIILRWQPQPGTIATPIDGFFMSRRENTDFRQHCLEKPLAAICVQGEKLIVLGDREYKIKPGDCLTTCVDMPSSSVLLDASSERPFLSIYFLLDRRVLADLLAEMRPEINGQANAGAIVAAADPDLLETFLRLARLVEKPEHAPILAPLILKELHYLLLAGPQGHLLQRIYMHEAKDSRVTDAIAWLRRHLDAPIPVGVLAKIAHMSVSSLHRHFKSITGLSPLQYHKRLRLYEAQRLMLAENERADAAAQAVGYESVAQFNREYKRMFGQPPRRDIKRRRETFAS